MEWPTLNHVFYIPLILAVGVLFGYWWGRTALRKEIAASDEARRERERRREERIARLQQKKNDAGAGDAAPVKDEE